SYRSDNHPIQNYTDEESAEDDQGQIGLREEWLSKLEDLFEVPVEVVAVAKHGQESHDDEGPQGPAWQMQRRCGPGSRASDAVTVGREEVSQNEKHQVIQVHGHSNVFFFGEKQQGPDKAQDHEGE